MIQTLNQQTFSEAVRRCARHNAVPLSGGDSRFVALQFRRNKIGEPTEILDVWEAPEGMPFCPVGFAQAEVGASVQDAETLSILWQFARGGH